MRNDLQRINSAGFVSSSIKISLKNQDFSEQSDRVKTYIHTNVLINHLGQSSIIIFLSFFNIWFSKQKRNKAKCFQNNIQFPN